MMGHMEQQMDRKKATLDYYDQAPKTFAVSIWTADMSDTRTLFSSHLTPKGLYWTSTVVPGGI